MVECTALERRQGESPREFESLRLRRSKNEVFKRKLGKLPREIRRPFEHNLRVFEVNYPKGVLIL